MAIICHCENFESGIFEKSNTTHSKGPVTLQKLGALADFRTAWAASDASSAGHAYRLYIPHFNFLLGLRSLTQFEDDASITLSLRQSQRPRHLSSDAIALLTPPPWSCLFQFQISPFSTSPSSLLAWLSINPCHSFCTLSRFRCCLNRGRCWCVVFGFTANLRLFTFFLSLM